uniref:Adhesion molecule with Ig like domain 1 n=1 Tax=Amphilophus citrinellus TaxID=61819 RepID=A0A3Q0SQH9_AMPCI
MVGSISFSWPAPVAVLGRRSCFILHLTLLLPAMRASGQLIRSPLDCQKTCLCTSNIISCSMKTLTNVPNPLPQNTAVLDLSFNSITRLHAEWTSIGLNRLQSLLLSNNNLTFLSSEAFVNVRMLRYLDLSSNGLRLLDEYIFEPLEQLEVLLLYNNHISEIDRSAFSGLSCLQRLYLSHNQITRIPLELVKERGRLENLRLLDVSSNRIKTLPLDEIRVLPARIKNGVYFHNNPLTCSCELYELVARWELRELSPSTDFKSSHTCMIPVFTVSIMSMCSGHLLYFNICQISQNNHLLHFIICSLLFCLLLYCSCSS